MTLNLQMTIISRNIRAHLSRESHFSNHSTKARLMSRWGVVEGVDLM